MDGWVGGWMDGWKEGRKEAKAGLRIAYSNQKLQDIFRQSILVCNQLIIVHRKKVGGKNNEVTFLCNCTFSRSKRMENNPECYYCN